MILDDANNDLFSANMRQGHCLTAPTEWSLLLHLHIPTAGLTYIMLLIFAKAPCYLEFFIAGFHAFFCSRGETQIWLGNLRVVVFSVSLFVMLVDLPSKGNIGFLDKI
jgi:hypothetical protein